MKVIMFSREFPSYHPSKGKPTNFVEKILNSDLWKSTGLLPKLHTIRAGNRWKVGEFISLRYWTGKPYRSTQLEFLQLEVKQTWNVIIETGVEGWMDIWINNSSKVINREVAENDGLSLNDFFYWFHNPKILMSQRFEGQIICWDENISY